MLIIGIIGGLGCIFIMIIGILMIKLGGLPVHTKHYQPKCYPQDYK